MDKRGASVPRDLWEKVGICTLMSNQLQSAENRDAQKLEEPNPA